MPKLARLSQGVVNRLSAVQKSLLSSERTYTRFEQKTMRVGIEALHTVLARATQVRILDSQFALKSKTKRKEREWCNGSHASLRS